MYTINFNKDLNRTVPHIALVTLALTVSYDPPSSLMTPKYVNFHLSEARDLVVFDVCFCSYPATDNHFRFPGVELYSLALHPNLPTKPPSFHLLLSICYYWQIVTKQQFTSQPASEIFADDS